MYLLSGTLISLSMAGCAGSVPRSAIAKTETPTPTTADGISIMQVASIVAKQRQPLLDAFAVEVACEKSYGECWYPHNAYDRWTKIDTLEATLANTLSAAKPVPHELSQLVDDTVLVAYSAQQARIAYEACNKTAATPLDCSSQMEVWHKGWQAMGPQLDAWGPYL